MSKSGIYDCDKLAEEWDQIETIRTRLRENKPLCVKVGQKPLPDSSVAECAANTDVLTPACQRLFASRGKLPDIQSLRDAVEELYKRVSRTVHDEEIDDNAWEVRKMLRLVKRKAGRAQVSQVPLLDLTGKIFIVFGKILIVFGFRFVRLNGVTCNEHCEDMDFQDLLLLFKPELQD